MQSDDKRRNDNEEESLDEDVIASDPSTEALAKAEVKQSQEDSVLQDQDSAEEVGEELQQLQALTQQLDNQLKRSLADYQNLQKRVQEEKANWIRISNKDLLLKLLPVLDTLMLAEKHTQDKNFALTVQQFLQVLKDEGVEKMIVIDEEFDPNTMEATGTTEGEEGKVIDEVRAGYMYHDMVLRPAQVIVGS